MSASWTHLTMSFFFGISIGIVYFFLLWVFVQKFLGNTHFQVYGFLGFFLRLAIVGAALLLVVKKSSHFGVILFLVGFFLLKTVAIKKIKTRESSR